MNEATNQPNGDVKQQQQALVPPVQYDVLLTRAELALAQKVSVRTVDALVADQEITPVRLRGKLVRFIRPDGRRGRSKIWRGEVFATVGFADG